jgi:hypothetical protein
VLGGIYQQSRTTVAIGNATIRAIALSEERFIQRQRISHVPQKEQQRKEGQGERHRRKRRALRIARQLISVKKSFLAYLARRGQPRLSRF